MGIICETEYFGLVECKQSQKAKKSSNHEWINLRNPLPHCGNNGQPYMLELRVKFWVPGHLVLQDTVRNIFYMQARSDLLEGRLRATDWETAAKLGALLAQADEIKFDANALTAKSTEPIIRKMREEPIVKGKKRKLSKQRSGSVEEDRSEVPIAVNSMPAAPVNPLSVYEEYCVLPVVEEATASKVPDNFLRHIAKEHQKLTGMIAKSAKYWLLENISKLPGFGEEVFCGMTTNDSPTRCDVSVGPHGIVVRKEDGAIK